LPPEHTCIAAPAQRTASPQAGPPLVVASAPSCAEPSDAGAPDSLGMKMLVASADAASDTAVVAKG
jgi:hypothetical protein